jgi:hypothetical protein
VKNRLFSFLGVLGKNRPKRKLYFGLKQKTDCVFSRLEITASQAIHHSKLVSADNNHSKIPLAFY